jgi:hypothetical protein
VVVPVPGPVRVETMRLIPLVVELVLLVLVTTPFPVPVLVLVPLTVMVETIMLVPLVVELVLLVETDEVELVEPPLLFIEDEEVVLVL